MSYRFIFEKSANYFTSPQPTIQNRISTLLPRSIMVAILLEPGQRAYSWYQHQKAHNDPTSLKYTFEQVLTNDKSSDKKLNSLRTHCLYPGMYLRHLKNWAQKTKVIIVDGELLRERPDLALNRFVETVFGQFVKGLGDFEIQGS